MMEKTYYVHEAERDPDDLLGIVSVGSKKDAWDMYKKYLVEEYKNIYNFERVDGIMHLYTGKIKNVALADIDVFELKYIETKGFCVPPSEPKCIKRHHVWSNVKSAYKNSNWDGCKDYTIPCMHCNVLKIIRVSNKPIDGYSKTATINYTIKPILMDGEIRHIEEPPAKYEKPILKNDMRACGLYMEGILQPCAPHENMILAFKADDNEDAIKMAEYLYNGFHIIDCEMNMSIHDYKFLQYGRYYLVELPENADIDKPSMQDIRKGKLIKKNVINFELPVKECTSDIHDWNPDGRLMRSEIIDKHEKAEIVKYCNNKNCNLGKVITVGDDKPCVSYVMLHDSDVSYKDK